MNPSQTLASFYAFLAERGLRFEAVLVGGVALHLLGFINRATKDCDVLWPGVLVEIALAAKAFAAVTRRQGEPLADDWLNDGAGLADGSVAGGLAEPSATRVRWACLTAARSRSRGPATVKTFRPV